MIPALGDVVARARGLAAHLLPEAVLEQLADSAGSAALAASLAQLGYPPAAEGSARSSAEAVQLAIEREGARRLAVLAGWLDRRRVIFACVFEDEERRVLRTLLRRSAAEAPPGSAPPREALGSLPRRLREALGQAGDPSDFVRLLRRAGHAYAEPLARALREHGRDLVALEAALDRTFAARALGSARRGGTALVAWVKESIDLENAWSVLLGASGEFLEGGRRLPRALGSAIEREPAPSARRAALAEAFADSALAEIFADAQAPLAELERRVRRARAAACARAARLDPLGPVALLALLLRLREETTRLRRIGWAVAQGVPESGVQASAWSAA